MRPQLIISILVICLGCVDENAIRQQRIEKEVDQRLEEFASIRNHQCIERIVNRAILAADSIMLKEAIFDIPDSLTVPDKQTRPERPEIEFPEFNKPLAPEIDSTKKDSVVLDSIEG